MVKDKLKGKEQEIIKYYKQGLLQKDIAKKFNVIQPAISYMLNKYNIKKNPRVGSRNPRWKGGIMYDQKRKLIYSPDHPKPDCHKKYCYEYRLIMEKYLDRYLKKGEIVHHKNGDVTDNRIKNLQVMTQSEHASLHSIEGDFHPRL